MDVRGQIDVFIVLGHYHVVNFILPGEEFERSPICSRSNAEMSGSSEIHIEVPDETLSSHLSEGSRYLATICCFSHPTLLVTECDYFSVYVARFSFHYTPSKKYFSTPKGHKALWPYGLMAFWPFSLVAYGFIALWPCGPYGKKMSLIIQNN